MKIMRKLLFLILLVFVFAACGGNGGDNGVYEPEAAPEPTPIVAQDEEYEDIDEEPADEGVQGAEGGLRIVSVGPKVTEIVTELGFAAYIVGTDSHSVGIDGLGDDLVLFDMMALDGEALVALGPDFVLMAGIVMGAGDHIVMLENIGIDAMLVPGAGSINGIYDTIRLVAWFLGAEAEGERIIADMQAEVAEIMAIAATIENRRTVYFEIDPAPMFSFGGGTFLNELLETVGAVNIFADEYGWIMVADEHILVANPDVIMTNVGWLDDPLGDMAARPGWDGLDAVAMGRLYQVDGDATSRANHNTVIALRQMAEAIYPEYFSQ
ncbi:MAG: ABC transporter substrate-binding protein [Defluviitaleaceae bacterium]|nr:ABC transporter substrate-binding protein [Defluviitaleaceae bacterium]